MTNKSFLSFWAIFRPFHPPDNPANQNFKIERNNHMMYGSWDMERNRIFCHSGLFFALLPPYGPRKSKLWKNEKTTEDIIILYMCTINDSHMMCGSWDMECNRQNFVSFWAFFCPFTPLTIQKIKILKNWEQCLEMLSLYTGVP